MTVPLFDTSTPLEPLQGEIIERLTAVVRGGRFILGPEVQAFEKEFARYLGVGHVVGVANGTDALTIALRAAGVGPGDEVVVPSYTFYASAEAIPPTGASPVFCDVDPETGNVTVESVSAAITPRTKAVIAVDLFGNPAPVDELREQTGLVVIEDAAQAAGATSGGRRAGSLGTVATFSFFPSKNLGCFGDGGAIATDDERIAEAARMLRFHGSKDKVTFDEVGYNSRLDELQAAILRVLLPHLDTWTEGRRAAARAYEEAGLGELVGLPVVAPGAETAWHLYVVRHPAADRLIGDLAGVGVQARGYYRTPVHRQPAMAPWAGNVELPVTDELARTNLAIPMSPVLSTDQANEVVAAIRGAVAAGHPAAAASASGGRMSDRRRVSDPVTIGVVGLGYWGPNLARNFAALPGAELFWCCDASEEARTRVAPIVPDARMTGRFEDLLEDDRLDAIVLATPVPTHAELAVRVLEAGKHCFVEKPLAQSVVDAERAVAAAEQSGRTLMVGHLLEYHPGVAMLKALVDEGQLGDIYCVYGNRVNLGKLRSDENALWSLGAHDVSVLLHIVQEEPYEVAAHGECYVREGVEDVVFCFLRFPSGVAAHLQLSWLDPHKERRFTIVGSKRMATFDDMAIEGKLTVYDKGFDEDTRSYGEYIARSGDMFSPRVPNTEPLRLECEHFLESIKTGTPPRSDGQSGLRVVRVLEQLQSEVERTRRSAPALSS